MAAATARAPKPSKQKGRPLAGGGLSRVHVSSNSDDTDSIRERQVQFLAARFAVPVSIAGTIAALAWEMRHG